MKLTIDLAVCTKSGECYYNHPELFRDGPDHYPELLRADAPNELESAARSAVEVCPSQAIRLIDDDTAQGA